MLYLSKFLKAMGFFAMLLYLHGCSSPTVLVPLSEQSVVKTRHSIYVAASGDTLYSIAFLSGLDYRELAAWNNISEPYFIHRGQKINLIKPDNYKKPGKEQVISIAKPDVITPLPKPGIKSPAAAIAGKKQVFNFNNTWKWPVSSNNIINYKTSKQNKGIDIIARHGIAVHASASGKVVYAGNGLKGYGNLVIIKHSESYLSAYAHNQSINVEEGQVIQQGEQIAKVGSSSAKQAKLHFEIRKNGTPVDPLKLLPRKVG